MSYFTRYVMLLHNELLFIGSNVVLKQVTFKSNATQHWSGVPGSSTLCLEKL